MEQRTAACLRFGSLLIVCFCLVGAREGLGQGEYWREGHWGYTQVIYDAAGEPGLYSDNWDITAIHVDLGATYVHFLLETAAPVVSGGTPGAFPEETYLLMGFYGPAFVSLGAVHVYLRQDDPQVSIAFERPSGEVVWPWAEAYVCQDEVGLKVRAPRELFSLDGDFGVAARLDDQGVWQDDTVEGPVGSLPFSFAGMYRGQADVSHHAQGHLGLTTNGLPEGSALFGGTAEVDDLTLEDGCASLRFYYCEEDLASLGLDEATVALYCFDPTAGEDGAWVLAGDSSNDTHAPLAAHVVGFPTLALGDWGAEFDDNFVWANIDHASLFSLAARPIPEPTTLSLLALGGLMIVGRKRR